MRLTKTNSGVSTRYTYDNGGRIILKEDGAQSTTYIWGGNRLLAKKLAGGAQYYYLYNGHGDVVQITDSAGNIVNSYEYDEWGNITSQTEGIENEFKYAGQTYDSETGLYYLRARYYDPTTGRFISKDNNEGSIVNPLSLNLYTYCVNNPIIFVDPSGNIYTFADPIINNEQQARAVLEFFRPDEIDLAYFNAGGTYGVAAGYTVRRMGKLGNLTIKAIKGTEKAINSFDDVAGYIKKNGRLPDNFITKDQAKALGWDGKKGNLAEVAPGKSIGGDIFKNKGNPLPDAPGRVWYEADINYTSGFRSTDRILYSNDGLIYKTSDHYKTFTQIK